VELLLFRRYFWVLKALCLLVYAFLAAKTINLIVNYQLEKNLTTQSTYKFRYSNFQAKQALDISPINDRNLFNAQREEISWKGLDMQGQEGSIDAAIPSTLPYQLVGTSVFDDPSSSLAVIWDTNKNESNSYTIKECSPLPYMDPRLESILSTLGKQRPPPCNQLSDYAIIKKITENRVYIYNQQSRRYEYFSLAGKESIQIPKPISSYTPPTSEVDISKIGESVKEISPDNYEIGNDDLDSALDNLAQISMQARAVPAIENGKSIGFKLVSIQPNSVFSKIGLKPGDIITRINGYDLNSPDKALEVYQKLRSAKRLTLDRKTPDGRLSTLTYTIR